MKIIYKTILIIAFTFNLYGQSEDGRRVVEYKDFIGMDFAPKTVQHATVEDEKVYWVQELIKGVGTESLKRFLEQMIGAGLKHICQLFCWSYFRS